MSQDTSRLRGLDPSTREYWDVLNEPAGTVWPERDPKPEVSTRDPRPADAPDAPLGVRKLAALAKAYGFEARVGYSRAAIRGVCLGTYRKVESFSVWFAPSHSTGYRPFALYERFVDAKEILVYDGRLDVIAVDPETRAGTPGSWKWSQVSVIGKGAYVELTITALSEFIELQGLVLPSWLEAKKKKTVKPVEA